MVSQLFRLRSPLRSLCVNTVLVVGWIIVVMTTLMRSYRTCIRPIRILQFHHYIRRSLVHRRAPKILLILLLALVSLYAIHSQLQQTEIIHVLHPGFPLIVYSEDSYPSVLEHDVIGKIPYQMQQDVALRFKHQPKPKSHFNLLSTDREPSCQALIKGDPEEINYALQYMDQTKDKPASIDLSVYIHAPEDCQNFIKSRGYITHALPEETDFPIAYSIMMYRDADQAERLLRAIYRPSNYYCIHVDAKADSSVQKAMLGVTKCLPHVFLASKQNIVDWAQFNSLEPWIYCMKDLWRYSWKYFINLTGQEFPLKTNLQIVKILKALNGSNVVDTTTYGHYARRWYENLPPPNNIQPYKGLVFVIVSRGYVDYILHDPVAHKLLEWVSHTDFPDESYFSTLNHNPHLAVPGSYKGNPETNADVKPYIARFVNWGVGWIDSQGRYPFYWPCGGKRVRRVCIFGIKDLELLVNRRELFANKFILDFQPLALDCLEEWHFNMTLSEYAGKLTIDTTWYQSLDIVKNKVL
ncbi:beta-1,3-galactosyl-O-glycosyl-glycoprotein beta-1,6-N-acetylglucosaminyltransferase-like isoform X1 [Biomphalaria glabrata]|uniref:Beta-1,3-galactosyl-O-glycosyl-glycoprotein beta-1,6-N-acetylglucosaminyltransferase-like isoform X1 n=1 Tax=Biomphalaria glabrata TaxID=6526 RepID=A0A9W2YF45_BIOGL|nr:beta-1,3-galactosyl-O-glycosyl-glycoprotein beta-1,6-N-acetylglucosaminyltransferase-like isoform X1 [Biomphalaria glabrata]XP_055861371.1 beta-1,3-galactosyl-O-glycosyl-glycoprotein beta-1,6-N-acetylglucosaminyltransferase-like isoform X1 [Biomphalaria glabrata]XP_055861372.1 beta-1,3-galactosyl-O-glycosyl-glycoprotein beta-1,6-N-acetylglucosaminyltransferase-like isoform X1 [Biomphalaria glabrata]XP_055861373.1 beta-1,3-galactosyl-O-glycosyl-glycoprotein beta-1,6-N-acetylglucosaminyltransfe